MHRARHGIAHGATAWSFRRGSPPGIRLLIRGAGAGPQVTAGAVLADLIELALRGVPIPGPRMIPLP